MSPNTEFREDDPLDSPIVERLIDDPAIIHEVTEDTVVLALRHDLVVHRSVDQALPVEFDQELRAVARPLGTLASIGRDGRDRRPSPEQGPASDEQGPAGRVEIWRLTDPKANAIDEARRLRTLTPDAAMRTRGGQRLVLPTVSPNHVCIVSPKVSGCPAGPPRPTPPPGDGDGFVGPCPDGRRARVVVIDTGYIRDDPPRVALDQRVTSVAGEYLNTAADPAAWMPDPPDAMTMDPDGRLDEISGHGTFIAGLIAHLCPAAEITAVGQRDEDIAIDGHAAPEQKRLYSSEVALAHALLSHRDADVIQLGFSFPTLDDYPSIPFTRAMEIVTDPDAPRPGVAVVTPAGNEESAHPFWPAALPDVIGVAATGRRGRHRARFSNWGTWLDCCARGEAVLSTYLHWSGPVQGDPDEVETFAGWARWDGTSFAAPKVSAAIARLVAAEERLLPVDAFARLVSGATDVRVTEVTDHGLSGPVGVTLPQLHVH